MNLLITKLRKEGRVTPQSLSWKFWIPTIFTCGSQSQCKVENRKNLKQERNQEEKNERQIQSPAPEM